MIIKGIKHITYNHLKEEVTLYLENGETKNVHMTNDDYLEMFRTGNFNLLKQYV